jgi:hypothetical protein
VCVCHCVCVSLYHRVCVSVCIEYTRIVELITISVTTTRMQGIVIVHVDHKVTHD